MERSFGGLKYDNFEGNDDDVVGQVRDLSLFHAFRLLVFFLIGIIVRFFTVTVAGVALSLNAVVVWGLRADKRAAEESCESFCNLMLTIHNLIETYVYWLLNEAWLLPE